MLSFNFNKQKALSWLNSIKPNQKKDFLIAHAKKFSIEYVYNTAALEWNTMSFPEVQTVLLDWITVWWHKLSEQQQIINQNDSFNYLIDLVQAEKFNLKKETFCKLNSFVSRDESLKWWEFRSWNVWIWGTDTVPPDFGELDNIYKKWVSEIVDIENPTLRAFVFYLFWSINQFFFDWNKRSSRLMLNWILLTNWFPILNIKARSRLEFNEKMLEFYDTREADNILEYLIRYYQKKHW